MRSIHERLFYRPLLESFAGPAQPHPGHGTDRAATEELLGGLGFAEPARAYDVLGRLVDPGRRIGKVLANLFPVMAPALALSPTPDAALVRLERIAEAVGDGRDVADLLATDPPSARRLAHLAGASSFAIDLLVADPSRILGLSDTLLGAETDAAGALVDAVARTAARELTPRESGEALSAVAVRVVREALAAAEPPADLPFAVIGMGKLGARELNVASDLDLMFVYEGEGAEAQGRAIALAEQVLRGIREAGWEPDADLRPEGRNGPLARSIAGYLEYWQRYAETWEFQALLRARAVAGDPDLGRRFELNAADAAFPPEGLTIDRVADIRRMRERIERERVKPPEAAKFHFKLGIGSLADVQFAVELSLMRHGGQRPEIRSRRTLEAIDRLAAAKLLPGSAARDLGEAFVFHTDIKNALEMDRRLHAEAVPAIAGRPDRARPAPRLRGVPSAELHRRLPARDPPRPTRDGTRVLRGGHVSQRDGRRRRRSSRAPPSGFGAEFARLFGADGWNVVMVARSGAAMESIAQEIEERHGVEVIVMPKDLARHGASAELMASLDQRGVTIDALVNNAGFSTYGEFWRDDPATQSDMLAVNVVALTELSRLVVPGMVERGHGRVLHLGSVGSFSAAPMTAAYAATKAYVLSLSLAMAEELAGTGVTVTCLCPGPTQTGFQERADMGGSALISGKQLPAAREVAEAGYAAMKAGKPYLVTGGSSRAFAFGSRFLPRTTTARIAGRSQRRV